MDNSKTLDDLSKFYLNFKTKMRAGGSKVGRTTKARIKLREELERRKALLEQFGKIPEDERTTQQGIYYKIRSQMEGRIDISRDSFIAALKNECIELGGDLSYREKLGIIAAERAQLFFRGYTYPINWERIDELANKGCDVILIEKEGVCTVLEPYARKRGIALLNSRGFATDYAKQVLKYSKRLGGNLFIVTDFDASGLLIAQKLPTIPRIGVDPQMVSELGLKREEVEEEYKAPLKHKNALPSNIQEEIANKRIEIDAVITAVGPEKFWNYLENKISNLVKTRDLTRSIDLSINLPSIISKPLNELTSQIRSFGRQKREDLKKELENWTTGLVDIEDKETQLQQTIVDEIEKNKVVKNVAEQLEQILEKISDSKAE